MTPATPEPEAVWNAQVSRVGALRVLRALPDRQAEAVGPFVFLDHFGPVAAPPDKLPAHPHAGIEVITYLLEGANEHTDSLGNVGRIGAGGAQWMRAGRGVLHAERNLPEQASTVHGLQIWARLPIAEQNSAPDYRAFQSTDVPHWTRDAARLRLLAGELEGRRGPIPLALPSLLVHVDLEAGGGLELELPEAEHQYGLYVIRADGKLALDGRAALTSGQFVRLRSGSSSVRLEAGGDAGVDVLLLGGEPAPRPLLFGGPFVFDSEAALVQANRRCAAGEMGTLDGVPY